MQSFLNVITLQTYTFFAALTPRLHSRSKRFCRRPQNLNAPRTYNVKFSKFSLMPRPQESSVYRELAGGNLTQKRINEGCLKSEDMKTNSQLPVTFLFYYGSLMFCMKIGHKKKPTCKLRVVEGYHGEVSIIRSADPAYRKLDITAGN